MKRILVISVLALLSLPAWGAIALVQISLTTVCTTNSATCDVTVSSTGTGNLLAGGCTGTIVENLSSVSGGGTWVICPTCFESDNSVKSTMMAYALSSTSGVTTITFTRPSTTVNTWKCSVWEFSPTAGKVFAFDTDGLRAQTTNVTNPAGVTLTIGGTNDVIVQIIKNGGASVTGISGTGYVRDRTNSESSWASSLNTVDGTAPTWTTSSSRDSLSAMAFKEVNAAATGQKNILLLGVGL